MKKTKMTCPMCKYYLSYDEELGSYVCTNCNFSFKTRAEQTEAEPDKDLSGNGENIIIPHIADGDEPEETEEKAEEETATVSEDTLETAEETVGEDPDEAKGSLDVYALDSDLLPEPEDGDAYISSDAFPDEPLPDEADEPEFVPAPPIQRPGSAAIGSYDIERPDYSNLTAPAHAEEPPAYSRTESAPVRPEPRRDDSGSNKKAITIGIIAGIACFLVAGIVFSVLWIFAGVSDSFQANGTAKSQKAKDDDDNDNDDNGDNDKVKSSDARTEATTQAAAADATPTPVPEPTIIPRPEGAPATVAAPVVTDPVELDYLVTDITSSSIDNENQGFNYFPWQLMDDDINTSWAEGVEGNGVGEYVDIYIPEGTLISGILLYNGYTKSDTVFYKNGAPTVLDLYSGDSGYRLELDTEQFQYAPENFDVAQAGLYITFDTPIVSNGCLRLTIVEVRDGESWDDTNISELVLYGSPAPETVTPSFTGNLADEVTSTDWWLDNDSGVYEFDVYEIEYDMFFGVDIGGHDITFDVYDGNGNIVAQYLTPQFTTSGVYCIYQSDSLIPSGTYYFQVYDGAQQDSPLIGTASCEVQ